MLPTTDQEADRAPVILADVDCRVVMFAVCPLTVLVKFVMAFALVVSAVALVFASAVIAEFRVL